jgi:hypothetical protein
VSVAASVGSAFCEVSGIGVGLAIATGCVGGVGFLEFLEITTRGMRATRIITRLIIVNLYFARKDDFCGVSIGIEAIG